LLLNARRVMTESPFKEGELLAGKYKIERMIAKGGMGVVVAAMHEALDQRVALKFLLPEGAADTDAIGRFLREARAAVRLRSEHVAKVLDVGTLDTGSPYIVMEYLEGRDLQAVLTERGRLPAPTAVSYVLQACEAIAEAHAHGIVHRDLKPANLFLTRRNDGTPCIKVLDFGISKHSTGALASAMTRTSALMGTPYYVSPEQLRSSKNVDARSDIWALGMILYELLTGSVAFPRDTLPELCTAIIYDPVPDLGSHGVEVAPELVAVVLRCLAKSPDERFQTLAELASALSRFVVHGDASAERISRILDPNARSPSVRPAPPSGVATVAEPNPIAPSAEDLLATRAEPWLASPPGSEAASPPSDSARTMHSARIPGAHASARRLATLALAVGGLVAMILWLVTTLGRIPSPRAVGIVAVPAPVAATEAPVAIAATLAPLTPAPPKVEVVGPEPDSAPVPAPPARAAPARKQVAPRPNAKAPAPPPSDDDDFGDRK
jgi:eukaryotic-like serine/threonine-protein kinase